MSTDDELIARQMLARCNATGQTFNLGTVEVVQRYADCSVFRCPRCKGTHDDRTRWGGAGHEKMGYTVLQHANDVGWWG